MALIASEVGEAINECRGEVHTENLQYELVDIILRTFDLCVTLNVDIEKTIINKMSKNNNRNFEGKVK